jgi:hypothetical protein
MHFTDPTNFQEHRSMAQRNRFNNAKRQKPHLRTTPSITPREERVIPERKAPTQYGKPFILLEDANKNTFEYQGGAWVPHTMTIAECREACQVTELPQKVNRMTRYEIRSPLA